MAATSDDLPPSDEFDYVSRSADEDLPPPMSLQEQVSKFGRRPLLQLVVIYATNQKVMTYAQKLQERFLSKGVDIILQTSVDQGKKGKAPKNKDIESQHLAEIITSSLADHLIVVGDRNLKNRSVHVKRKGKLMEMKVPELLALIWSTWPRNGTRMNKSIRSLNDEQLEELLYQYCGIRHVIQRAEFLRTLADELSASVLLLEPSKSGLDGASVGMALSGSAEVREQRDLATAKLLHFQKCSVRLHKQLNHVCSLLKTMSVQEVPVASRGAIRGRDYAPNAPRTPHNSLAPLLKRRLLNFVTQSMREIEENCDVVADFGLDDWTKYMNGAAKTEVEAQDGKEFENDQSDSDLDALSDSDSEFTTPLRTSLHNIRIHPPREPSPRSWEIPGLLSSSNGAPSAPPGFESQSPMLWGMSPSAQPSQGTQGGHTQSTQQYSQLQYPMFDNELALEAEPLHPARVPAMPTRSFAPAQSMQAQPQTRSQQQYAQNSIDFGSPSFKEIARIWGDDAMMGSAMQRERGKDPV